MDFVLQPPYLQGYADEVAIKGAWLHNCFGFVNGTGPRICRPVLNNKVVYNGHTRVHGKKFQSVDLPNVLIVNHVGQWQGRRHDCVLSLMNWLY